MDRPERDRRERLRRSLGRVSAAIADLGPRHAGTARGAGLLAACLGPLRSPARCQSPRARRRGRCAALRTASQTPSTKTPVVLGAHQHIDSADAALRIEQLEEVRLAVHDAEDPSLAREAADAAWATSCKPSSQRRVLRAESSVSCAASGSRRMVPRPPSPGLARGMPRRRPAAHRTRSAAPPGAARPHSPQASDAGAGPGSSPRSGCVR